MKRLAPLLLVVLTGVVLPGVTGRAGAWSPGPARYGVGVTENVAVRSEGSFGLFDPVQAQDGATLVRWAAGLAHSNGKVGLLGLSYLGINQFFTAAAVGPGSPLRGSSR